VKGNDAETWGKRVSVLRKDTSALPKDTDMGMSIGGAFADVRNRTVAWPG